MRILTTIITTVHQKCLDFRALDRLVQSVRFEEALRLDPNNVQLHQALIDGNIAFVESWITVVLKKEIGEYNMKELRDVARKLGIPFYTTYSKDDLLVEILNVTGKTEKVAV